MVIGVQSFQCAHMGKTACDTTWLHAFLAATKQMDKLSWKVFSYSSSNKLLGRIHANSAVLHSAFLDACMCAVAARCTIKSPALLYAAVRQRKPDDGRGYERDYRQSTETVR